MDDEENLKQMELRQHEEEEGDGYEDEFENENEHSPQDGEGEQYDEEEDQDIQNPYDQNEMIRNTFYPPQNPIMGGGFGGALRPVSANVQKSGNRK